MLHFFFHFSLKVYFGFSAMKEKSLRGGVGSERWCGSERLCLKIENERSSADLREVGLREAILGSLK